MKAKVVPLFQSGAHINVNTQGSAKPPPWAMIGVGTKVSFAPPSEPDWRISRIRLSSWWLTFKKIGQRSRGIFRLDPRLTLVTEATNSCLAQAVGLQLALLFAQLSPMDI